MGEDFVACKSRAKVTVKRGDNGEQGPAEGAVKFLASKKKL